MNEPLLEFGLEQTISDPHSGLTLFGPYDRDVPSHPCSIPYALVGCIKGITLFRDFVDAIQESIVSCQYERQEGENKAVRLWPPFPGFEAAFHSILPPEPARIYELDSQVISNLVHNNDPHKRAYELVNLYLDCIRLAAERDEGYKLLICIEPDEIWKYCRPKSRVKDGIGAKISARTRKLRRRQPDMFNFYNPEQYDMSVDFRRQLKARIMEYNIPIQIIRESTLNLNCENDDRGLTCLSDRAWNLSTTIYYKAGGKPWRLYSARNGVCYIGIVFRKTENNEKSRTACCAAQMFLDTGDGVVFKGETGPWYSPESRECHLDAKHAEELLRGVIETYRAQGGKELKEIFLHSRSTISESEFKGYLRACPDGVKLVGVRVAKTRDGLRLYRPGKWCVQRGTSWVINNNKAYLWASGFKKDILTYDGWEVPIPLRIDIQHGKAPIMQVVKDILGLTKLNYNTCKIGDSQPVTIGFSNKVGEILVSNPSIKNPKPNFKYYI